MKNKKLIIPQFNKVFVILHLKVKHDIKFCDIYPTFTDTSSSEHAREIVEIAYRFETLILKKDITFPFRDIYS